jgi:hypothetical protein
MIKISLSTCRPFGGFCSFCYRGIHFKNDKWKLEKIIKRIKEKEKNPCSSPAGRLGGGFKHKTSGS